MPILAHRAAFISPCRATRLPACANDRAGIKNRDDPEQSVGPFPEPRAEIRHIGAPTA